MGEANAAYRRACGCLCCVGATEEIEAARKLVSEKVVCPRHQGRAELTAKMVMLVRERAEGGGHIRKVLRRYKCLACGWIFDTEERHIGGHQSERNAPT